MNDSSGRRRPSMLPPAPDPTETNAILSESTGAVVLGKFNLDEQRKIITALERGGLEARFFNDAEASYRALKAPESAVPSLVLADASFVDLESLIGCLRSDVRLFGTVVVAIVPSAIDRHFVTAHGLGVDDVIVAGDFGAFTRRAAALRCFDPRVRPAPVQGRAVIAHPNVNWRRTIGRMLRQSSFYVDFAQDANELREIIEAGEPPTLAVCGAEIEPNGAIDCVKSIREMNDCEDLPTIITGHYRDLLILEDPVELMDRTELVDDESPPDNLLFVANELLRPGLKNLRSSPRVLYDTICAFRPAGQMHPVPGLTYNISSNGLYVRTLDPPKTGTIIWFELRPPDTADAVHLRGQVVWVHEADQPGGLSPAGFGVRILSRDCPPNDLALYHEAVERLTARPRRIFSIAPA